MATSTIRKPMEIKTITLSGTTNASGALSIQGDYGVSTGDLVLSVACTNDTNVMCVPWKYGNSSWYVKCTSWQNMGAYANKSTDVVIKYIPNGYAL